MVTFLGHVLDDGKEFADVRWRRGTEVLAVVVGGKF